MECPRSPSPVLHYFYHVVINNAIDADSRRGRPCEDNGGRGRGWARGLLWCSSGDYRNIWHTQCAHSAKQAGDMKIGINSYSVCSHCTPLIHTHKKKIAQPQWSLLKLPVTFHRPLRPSLVSLPLWQGSGYIHPNCSILVIGQMHAPQIFSSRNCTI